MNTSLIKSSFNAPFYHFGESSFSVQAPVAILLVYRKYKT